MAVSLSAKQLAMAFLKEKLDPSNFVPSVEDLGRLNNDNAISEKKDAEVRKRIEDEITKIHSRFQKYVEKYCQ